MVFGSIDPASKAMVYAVVLDAFLPAIIYFCLVSGIMKERRLSLEGLLLAFSIVSTSELCISMSATVRTEGQTSNRNK